MDPFYIAIVSAFWLGILTSISPCPMATNIAAISYIGKRVEVPKKVLLSGLLYTMGRVLTYFVLGFLIVVSTMSVPDLANFLQKYINIALGPILILVGLFLMEVFRFSIKGTGISERMQNRVNRFGVWGAGLLGILFALSFCPVSAALFFGSLIPIAIQHESTILIPSVYGVGTALPVFVFAILIVWGTRFVGIVFSKLTTIEKWARRITGVIFLAVGLYYTLIYIFGVEL
ncbi:MAG: aromatic aminobenezylarsenical efflux permease ArsG family transporter [bacterium]